MTQHASETVLVTGAGKRVGAAIAIKLAEKGRRIAIHYRSSEDGALDTLQKVQAAGGDGALFKADLDQEGHAEALISNVVETFGRLDILIPSAANFLREKWESREDLAWEQSMRTNLEAPRQLAKHATPYLRESQGTIVFLTCASTAIPYADYPSYIVSKGAVSQLMRVLALELAPEVRVNAVAPGTVLPPPGTDEATLTKLANEVPLGRIGCAQDIADAVAYLAEARFVTGQELRVDGGYSLRPLCA